MAIFLITLKSDRDTRHCLVEHAANESQTRLDAAVAQLRHDYPAWTVTVTDLGSHVPTYTTHEVVTETRILGRP